MINPWVILGTVALMILIGAGSYRAGAKHTADHIAAQEARDAAVAARVEESAQKGAAEAIAQIQVKNVTIRQKVEREIERIPADCVAPDGVRQLTDEALTNGAGSAGDSRVSGTNPDGGGDLR